MKMLTTGKVAKALGVSVWTVRNLIGDGVIPAQRITENSQYRVPLDELKKYAEAHNLKLLEEHLK